MQKIREAVEKAEAALAGINQHVKIKNPVKRSETIVEAVCAARLQLRWIHKVLEAAGRKPQPRPKARSKAAGK